MGKCIYVHIIKETFGLELEDRGLRRYAIDLINIVTTDHFLPVNVSTTTSGDPEVVSPVDFSTGQFRPTKMYGYDTFDLQIRSLQCLRGRSTHKM